MQTIAFDVKTTTLYLPIRSVESKFGDCFKKHDYILLEKYMSYFYKLNLLACLLHLVILNCHILKKNQV